MVLGAGGYGSGVLSQYDFDDNGVHDFFEAGGPITSLTSPTNKLVSQNQTTEFEATGTALSIISYQWQVSEDNGENWDDISDDDNYSGSKSTKLTISSTPTSFNSNNYRAILSTPGFACGIDDTTQVARLIVLADNDGDGVQDLIDQDDDNDGILDIDEGFADIDGDGIPNFFDLDSDNDNCNDVIEAGYEDSDGDGILGDSVDTNGDGIKEPANVDNSGRVIGWTGYNTPADLDENLVHDYLEKGSQAAIVTQPVLENQYSEFSDFELIVNASSESEISYQWQMSDDCENWVDLDNSPGLMITGIFRTKLNNNPYYYGIELYALKDIDNLSDYGITASSGTSTNTPNQQGLSSESLKKGQYLMLNYNSSWKNFFSDESSASFKEIQLTEVAYMSEYDRFNITLYSKKSGSWKKIDVYLSLIHI